VKDRGMSKNRRPPALNAVKHGGYSNLALLPGEDPKEFAEFARRVALEYRPAGPSEESVVAQLTKVLWRTNHLGVYQLVARVSKRWHSLLANKNEPDFDFNQALLRFALQTLKKMVLHFEHAKEHAEVQQKLSQGLAEFNLLAKQVVEEDGVDADQMLDNAAEEIALALAGDDITHDNLIKELETGERLYAFSARLLKMLFQIKAMKQMSGLDVPPVPTRSVSGPMAVIEQTVPADQVSVSARAFGDTGKPSEEAAVEPTVAPAEASALPTMDAPTLIPASEDAVPVPANTEPREMPTMSEAVPEPAAKANCTGTTIEDGTVVAGADQVAGPAFAPAPGDEAGRAPRRPGRPGTSRSRRLINTAPENRQECARPT
jgi:hypothetical protein